MLRRSRRPSSASGLGRFSEPFPPHGALAAKGAENLLGRPRLDPLIVLVREAVQNSWDARLTDGSPLRFAISARHAGHSQRRVLSEQVFHDPPKAATRLREVLTRDDLVLLALTDTGASGLAGPTRADRPPRRGEPSNFVDLLFNIGQPAEREFGGGTYGFGRTISYVVSEGRAIVVYSRTGSGRSRQSRLVAAAFTDHYAERNQRYTGRHWWGHLVGDSVEPVVGDEADALAAAIGLPLLQADETGTTICVVAPDLRGRTTEQACRFMAGALAWNFWPKMAGDSASTPAVDFAVSLDGQPVAVPAPSEIPPLAAFVACLDAVRRAELESPRGWGLPEATDLVVEPVVLPRTGETMGWLALTRVALEPRPIVDEGADDDAELGPSAPFEPPAHHIALLREPELIVEYLSVAEMDAIGSEYVGVFKPVITLDRAFAKAEPPTHDGWNANLVAESKLRRFVNVSLRTIRETALEFSGRTAVEPDGATERLIAELVDDLFATGGAPQRADAATIDVDAARLIETSDHGSVRDVDFTVEHAPRSQGTFVEVAAHVATHDGWTVERDPSLEGTADALVEVIGFIDEAGAHHPGHQLTIARGAPTRWTVRFRAPGPAAVGVDIVPTSLRTDTP